MSDTDKMQQTLEGLKSEHRHLDHAILSMSGDVHPDMIKMQRLKKRKLQLRDQISWLENVIYPNIIA